MQHFDSQWVSVEDIDAAAWVKRGVRHSLDGNTLLKAKNMPTGYTCGIADGTVTTFEEYALTCARAFGATIMLRDEPLSSEIPEFKPSPYHQEQLAESMEELIKIQTASNAELIAKWRAWRDKRLDSAKKGIADREEQKARYERMLADAKRFVAPTESHQEYAKFICKQLEESIEFDCSIGYYDEMLTVPSVEEWKQETISDLQRSIEYHQIGWADEVARVDQRNEWVKQLREAIAKVAPLTSATSSERSNGENVDNPNQNV